MRYKGVYHCYHTIEPALILRCAIVAFQESASESVGYTGSWHRQPGCCGTGGTLVDIEGQLQQFHINSARRLILIVAKAVHQTSRISPETV